jgi:phosphoribosylaminoimidazole-succinocarboxamide synthase
MAHTWDSEATKAKIQSRLASTIASTDLASLGLEKLEGKVRDVYLRPGSSVVILVTTDRISAFDRILATVPYKGQVLSQVSAWWFGQTKDIIANHLIGTPDPNVVIAKRCKVFPIEFVVRGYITGTTSTSMWTNYAKGVRNYCGLVLPEGLVQNQKLTSNVVTPTTKETEHDRLISPDEIASEGWMKKEEYEYCAEKALELFQRGQKIALDHGLLLVDTKYEFGTDEDGNILLVDEIHTPDSSRYWMADSYEARFAAGQTPLSIDKDIIRRWYNEHCDPYNDVSLPKAPEDLVVTLATRYIELYERITGTPFEIDASSLEPVDRINSNLSKWIKENI